MFFINKQITLEGIPVKVVPRGLGECKNKTIFTI